MRNWLSYGRLGLLLAVALFITAGGQAVSAQTNTVVYDCSGGTAVNATFDNSAQTLTLEIAGDLTVRLNQAVSGSGMRYVSAGGYEAYGKANWLNIIRPGQPELKCKEIGRIDPPSQTPQRQALPAPFQPQQQAVSPSFNCNGRLNATEARICANPMLAGLDNNMASTYSWLSGQLGGSERNRLKNDQRNWLGQRNRCGANDACIEREISSRIGYLNEWMTPGAPQQGQGAGLFQAKSWGGIVRSGPGTGYARIASLNEGEPITVIERTGQFYQGRPWFKISFRGQLGYHWGGIICPVGRSVPGTFQVCQ